MAGKPAFNRRSTAQQVTQGLDLSGKTALITGVNSGLGLESMRVLSERGAHVIGAARTLDKAREACASVAGATTAVACELSDFDAVVACAQNVLALDRPIDILMCNAGIMALPELEQKYGLEMQFVTNHLGHYLLIRHLLQSVLAAPAGRIVILSSGGHIRTCAGGIDFDNLSGESGYEPWSFYGQSKLANLLTAAALSRELQGTGVCVNSLHPGVIRTNLGRNTQGLMSGIIKLFAPLFERSIAQGAATQCYVAAHPAVDGISGEYFADCKVSKPSRYGRDLALAQRLLQVSDELLCDYLPD